MRSITTTDANREFSKLLRDVMNGSEVMILSRGKPVAKITSVSSVTFERNALKKHLLSRLKAQVATGARNWTRDELYDESSCG
ncbi:Prevent-host-death family protein [uncultured Desulfobacterium sp.]|uniref:Antitoxin n=1 Tax=uncultured Desulfobacterium sp. TaxID=201089 RepID=A0A445MSL9_9BACT|nr:Prevent-host-death family protein [uncultured Desulfobacterium sp.]